MIQRRVLRNVEDTARRAGSRIRSAEDEAFHACVDHCAGAHRTRLECHVQRRIEQTITCALFRGRAYRHDFGVRCRVIAGDRPIKSLGDNCAIVDDNRADRNFTRGLRLSREIESAGHEEGVIGNW